MLDRIACSLSVRFAKQTYLVLFGWMRCVSTNRTKTRWFLRSLSWAICTVAPLKQLSFCSIAARIEPSMAKMLDLSCSASGTHVFLNSWPPFTWSWETFASIVPGDIRQPDVMRLNDDYWINTSNSGGWNHVWDGQLGERSAGNMLPSQALDYLIDTRKFQCGVYNDRVYSILSLFNPPLSIVVDYKDSKEQIHKHLSGALMQMGESCLLYSTNRKSWKVDWDLAPDELVG